jgi:hypothetical protein
VTTLDDELQRLMDLDNAVRNYLSHLAAVEQGADDDEAPCDYWREQMQLLTID